MILHLCRAHFLLEAAQAVGIIGEVMARVERMVARAGAHRLGRLRASRQIPAAPCLFIHRSLDRLFVKDRQFAFEPRDLSFHNSNAFFRVSEVALLGDRFQSLGRLDGGRHLEVTH